jgi:hypothetical protein
MSRRLNALLLALAAAALPSQASGQFGRAQTARVPTGWAPIEVGVRGGYDYTSRGNMVGAQIRIPVLPSGHVELVPNGDITFLPTFKEYMGGVDVVAISGGRRGGLYVGGGLTWRTAFYDSNRETRRTPVIVAGAKSPAIFGSPIRTQLEVRWIRVDTDVKPKTLNFGINLPLWGWER